jgi:uncharacterized membrane protein
VLLGYMLLGYLIFNTEGSLFQVLLAASLALFGLGFSITAALAPQPANFGTGERIALSTYLSLSVGGILGFALSRSAWGLGLESLLVSALLLNLVCYLVVVYRRRRLENTLAVTGQNLNSFLGPLSEWWRGQSSLSLGITLLLLLLIAAGGMAFSTNLLAPGIDPPMTEFFLLNGDQQIQEFPETLSLREGLTLTYGVINREDRPLSYYVLASARGETVGRSPQIFLEAGEAFNGQLSIEFPLTLARSEEQVRVDFELYQGESVSRSLHLWFTVE